MIMKNNPKEAVKKISKRSKWVLQNNAEPRITNGVSKQNHEGEENPEMKWWLPEEKKGEQKRQRSVFVISKNLYRKKSTLVEFFLLNYGRESI